MIWGRVLRIAGVVAISLIWFPIHAADLRISRSDSFVVIELTGADRPRWAEIRTRALHPSVQQRSQATEVEVRQSASPHSVQFIWFGGLVLQAARRFSRQSLELLVVPARNSRVDRAHRRALHE